MLDAVTDKGRNPPCWFRLVDDKSEPGAKRQRDVKIFDVKIEDDGFVVIKHNNDKTPEPIEFGNLPSSELKAIFKDFNCLRFDIDSGIIPEILFLNKFNVSKCSKSPI